MILAEITLGARQFVWPAVALASIALAALTWSYGRSRHRSSVSVLAALLKALGVAALAVCLVEPLFTGTRPRPGSNLFLVVADNSRSLQIADAGSTQTRGQILREQLGDDAPWLTRLGQDFDLRRYVIDESLHPVKSFNELTQEGDSSSLAAGLQGLAARYRDRPVAGILLLTDGNATDAESWRVGDESGPPIFPVAVGADAGLVDLSVARVEVSQTNFEAAPVTLTATLVGRGLARREVAVRVLDESGQEIERRKVGVISDTEPRVERFLLRPEKTGISFYTVHAFLKDEETLVGKPGPSVEATRENNQRSATVDRGGGPYRVLYVGGRPSWEFKFLRRAIDEDDEVHLVGLVRIARKEPKFAFLGHGGERTNPLFRGFGNQEDEQAEQYDQPVLVRLGTIDDVELRGGFPKGTEELFPYHAVIFDDVESAFFTQDQLSLVQQFVSKRGGGFLMLGGVESFVEGGYQRGPIAEMLPVYLDKPKDGASPSGFRLQLTREGWLQPWVRLRTTEPDEESRLEGMPEFLTLNRIDSVKPGASVLAQVKSADDKVRPALVVQQFGRGRTAALMVGDLWRWNMRRTDPTKSDLDKAWRQMLRWLVSDVPARVDVETVRDVSSGPMGRQIRVRARDPQFEPLDNATVLVRVETPDKKQIELAVEASGRTPGQYETTFIPKAPGNYRVLATVTGADGSEVGRREAGWVVEPQTEEFRSLTVNREFLDRLARDTQGEIVAISKLDDFVASLPNRKVPIVETWTYPLWDRWPVFALAVCCLVGEWGLRRWKGLP